MELFKSKKRDYARINIEYDSESKNQKIAEVRGDEFTIASVIGALIHNLLQDGFDRELLEHAIEKSLKDSKKKIQVKEIKLSKETEDELREIIEKIVKEEK